MGMAAGTNNSPGARARRLRRNNAPMSEINVTPFVDVMLVLLIIFMVAAPLLTVGVPLKLPETAAKPLPTEQREPLTISVTATGELFLQKTPITAEDLIPKLRVIAEERQDNKIYLRGDAGVNYGQVMQVMGALNAGGFRNIGLVTEPIKSGSGE